MTYVAESQSPLGRLGDLVELALAHLGLDLAFASELTEHGQELRAVAGDSASFGMCVGDRRPLEDSYCAKMVVGDLPNLILDTAGDARVARLPVTGEAGIGSYIGVPLRLGDGSVFGSLCCLSHRPDLTLGERDVRFMTLLAEMASAELSEQADLSRRRQALHDLIVGEAVEIAYQPIIGLADRRVWGVEALSRFPAGRNPADVFAEAHQLGLGVSLERLAIRQALKAAPLLGPEQFLSLNISPEVAIAAAPTGRANRDLPLRQLVAEITENVAVDSYPVLRGELTELRRQGLRLAIDDAGAGYASLRHVVELQPDYIKIDRSLIDGISSDRARRVAVSSLVILALDLDAAVIAEGVETVDDLTALEDLGVDAAQGYLLGRPSTDPSRLAAWTSGCPTSEELLILTGHGARGGGSR